MTCNGLPHSEHVSRPLVCRLMLGRCVKEENHLCCAVHTRNIHLWLGPGCAMKVGCNLLIVWLEVLACRAPGGVELHEHATPCRHTCTELSQHDEEMGITTSCLIGCSAMAVSGSQEVHLQDTQTTWDGTLGSLCSSSPEGKACKVTAKPSFFRSTGFRAMSSLSSASAAAMSSAAKKALAGIERLSLLILPLIGDKGCLCKARGPRLIKALSFDAGVRQQ